MKGIIIVFMPVSLGGIAWYTGMLKRSNTAKQTRIDRLKPYYEILNHWLLLKQQGKTFEEYFIDHNIHTIAIYGMAELGKRLYAEIEGMESVEVRYVIDKGIGEQIKSVISDAVVVSMNEKLPDVDAIVVTPVFAYEEIKRDLNAKCNIPIVSIEDVVFHTYEEVWFAGD